MENTARIHMMGGAAIVVSSIKLEDWKLAEKYAPEALTITDDDGDPAFRVMTGAGAGSISKYGVVWGAYRSEEGNATVTVLLDEDLDDPKAAVMEIAGSALLDLIEMEQTLPDVLSSVREKMQKIESCITRI